MMLTLSNHGLILAPLPHIYDPTVQLLRDAESSCAIAMPLVVGQTKSLSDVSDSNAYEDEWRPSIRLFWCWPRVSSQSRGMYADKVHGDANLIRSTGDDHASSANRWPLLKL